MSQFFADPNMTAEAVQAELVKIYKEN
jgi:hypothetical protein